MFPQYPFPYQPHLIERPYAYHAHILLADIAVISRVYLIYEVDTGWRRVKVFAPGLRSEWNEENRLAAALLFREAVRRVGRWGWERYPLSFQRLDPISFGLLGESLLPVAMR